MRAILYSSNSKNFLWGISCPHCTYSYSGIGSIKRIFSLSLRTCMFLKSGSTDFSLKRVYWTKMRRRENRITQVHVVHSKTHTATLLHFCKIIRSYHVLVRSFELTAVKQRRTIAESQGNTLNCDLRPSSNGTLTVVSTVFQIIL